MQKLKSQNKTGASAVVVSPTGTTTATSTGSPSTPTQLADRWHWHPESVRRALRERRLASIVIGRRRLIPASEIERVEREGFIARAE